MAEITPQSVVRDLAVEHPRTRRVFERFEIDYCCGGGLTLDEAAAGRQIETDELIGDLREAAEAPPTEEERAEADLARASLTELVDHIQARHHTFMKENLPRLDELSRKALLAHRETHGRMLARLRDTFLALREEIEMHLMKEEQILFPYIRAIEAHAEGRGPMPEIHCITVRNPIQQMRLEHDHAGEALQTMRELTDDYALPEQACPTFEGLYEGLQALEDDLHNHIHLENNILFPRAIEREAAFVSL